MHNYKSPDSLFFALLSILYGCIKLRTPANSLLRESFNQKKFQNIRKTLKKSARF